MESRVLNSGCLRPFTRAGAFIPGGTEQSHVSPSQHGHRGRRSTGEETVSAERSERRGSKGVKVSLTPKGNQVVKRAPKPVQGKMIYGLRKLKKDELILIYHSVLKLVEIMEAQNVKVTFFFDQEA